MRRGETTLRCAIALATDTATVPAMKWYYAEQGQRVGPVERELLDERIRDGTIQAATLVWRAGLSDWRPAADVAELEVPPSLPALPPALPPMDATPSAHSDAARTGAEEPAAQREHPGAIRALRASAPNATFAGFWARFAAKLIDGLLLFGAGILLADAVGALFYQGALPVPPDWRGFIRAQGLMSLANAIVAICFSVYFIRRYEATPGKLMLGLRVIRRDGTRVGAGKIILRYFGEQLSTLLFLSGYVMVAFDDENRALHDYLCDTRVVKGRRGETDDPS
jgi:uncharacterized RDD family membrane protein YckC